MDIKKEERRAFDNISTAIEFKLLIKQWLKKDEDIEEAHKSMAVEGYNKEKLEETIKFSTQQKSSSFGNDTLYLCRLT